MERVNFTAAEEETGTRIDIYLSDKLNNLTRSAVQSLCLDGNVLVHGKSVPKNYRLAKGDHLEVLIPPPRDLAAEPQNIPLDIVYEDGALLVVNKPKGMVVHPAAGNEDGTLVNALLHHCGESLSGIGGVIRPGIVHRIDKDTSGLLVVAKSDAAHQSLSEQLKVHSITRRYHAVVYGGIKVERGQVNAPIGRHPTDRKKMCVTQRSARHAVTHYQVEERLRGFTYLTLELETGRTHQIRVHMAYLGHPVAGDPVYGPKKVIRELEGQCLHAGLLGFRHPDTGAYLEFSAPLPDYFTIFLQKYRERSS